MRAPVAIMQRPTAGTIASPIRIGRLATGPRHSALNDAVARRQDQRAHVLKETTMKHEHRDSTGMGPMMVMMMAMCFGVVILFAVIPSIGWPLGMVIGIAAGGLMLYLHQRYMRHGSH